MPSVGGVPKGQIPGGFFWLFNILSAVMSALAIVALARRAFVAWSLTVPMALIMDAYAAIRDALLEWADPYLQAALTWLGSWIGWRPTLYPHWRDVLVIVALWVAAHIRAWLQNGRWAPSVLLALFAACLTITLGASRELSAGGWLALQMVAVVLAGVLYLLSSRRIVERAVFLRTVGLTILSGFLGAFCFFAIDAGLKLVMG
jgi:hypothetical protein